MRFSILTSALALLAIPAIVSAHGGNNEPNVVHACISNVSKVVRIVGVTGSCIAAPPLVAETPAHWDIQGPPGAPGINGTNGADGAPGTNGTNGTNGINGTNGTNGIDGTSVTFVDYFSGSQGGCPNGGVIYAAGNPPVNAYVCNGINGTNGTNGAGTRADGPCFDNTNRYVDCGNGTVTDTVTGLIWLKQWDCLANNSWATANQAAAGLKDGDCNLTDNSSPGDWRLPTKAEWEATIARAVALGCVSGGSGIPPSLTNNAGTDCIWTGELAFGFVEPGAYWSGTSNEGSPSGAWRAYLLDGDVSVNGKAGTFRVWPVRGGPR